MTAAGLGERCADRSRRHADRPSRRMVALHRVGLFADVPGRTLAAAGARDQVDSAEASSSSRSAAVEEHLYAVVSGSLRVHRGDRVIAELGPGSTVGELAALVPRAALRIGHGARGDDLPADRPAGPRGASPIDRPSPPGSSPRWSPCSGSGRGWRPTRRPRERARRLRPWSRRGGSPPSPGVRCDGRAARHRRQCDVPRGLRVRLAPATYIAIALLRIVVSGAIARTAQRFDLLGIALSVLGAAAAGIGLAWIVARGGTAVWVSVPLLVLFLILIQLGFVFIGGRARAGCSTSPGSRPASRGSWPASRSAP